MKLLRVSLWVLGSLLMLFGGLWTLQGLGIVMWPANYFMLADRQSAVNGTVIGLAGVAMLLLALRIRSR